MSVLLPDMVAEDDVLPHADDCAAIDTNEVTVVARTSDDACTIVDTNAFLAPAGPGIEGSLMAYVSAPLCDVPANTFQPANVQDPRVCDANAADLKHAEPCHKAD